MGSEIAALHALSGDLLNVVIGALLAALGLAALAVTLARRDAKALRFFGLACLLYGIRLAATAGLLRLALPLPPVVWPYLIAFITYLLPLPILQSVRCYLGSGWRSSLLILQVVQTVYALGAIVIDCVFGPDTANPPNAFLVLLLLGLIVLNGVRAVGMLVFVGCLGYVIARRLLANERALLAVSFELRESALRWGVRHVFAHGQERCRGEGSATCRASVSTQVFSSRLCRLMCGRSSTFRSQVLLVSGATPRTTGHSPGEIGPCYGRSKTFRTSGGGAAKTLLRKVV